MKRAKPFIFALTLAGVWILASSDITPNRYGGYTPYFMERPELEKSVSWTVGRGMKEPGKIWIDGSRIFVIERYKGVHVIDAGNPSAPKQAGYIIAPGCMDVAVRGDIIYLDNAVDLVAFDMNAKEVTERLKNYFPAPVSPSGDYYYGSSNLILVGWEKTGR